MRNEDDSLIHRGPIPPISGGAEFRWEAFNLFNRSVFGTGNTNLNSNTFGVVLNQVNDPRQMQLALKFYW